MLNKIKQKTLDFFDKMKMRKVYTILYLALLFRIAMEFRYSESFLLSFILTATILYVLVKKAHDKMEGYKDSF